MLPNYRYAPLRSAYAPSYGSGQRAPVKRAPVKRELRATGSTEANVGEYFGKRRGGVLGQASGRRSLGKSFRGAL